MSPVINGQGSSAFHVWKAWQRLQFEFKNTANTQIFAALAHRARVNSNRSALATQFPQKNWVVRVQQLVTERRSKQNKIALLRLILSAEIMQN